MFKDLMMFWFRHTKMEFSAFVRMLDYSGVISWHHNVDDLFYT